MLSALFCFSKGCKLFWRCFGIAKQELMINEEIKDKEVRLIGADGAQLGVVSGKEALAMADEQNLDLVKIAPQAKPPVCRIMDYGKYRFELAKREKEQRKNQKVIDVKEVRLSPNIDEHDFQTKVNQGIKFLKSGDKVKVSVRFRGREITHSASGKELLLRVKDAMAEVGVVEKDIKLEGRSMAMFVSPKKA
ncbi:MAG: translation initiation factor IF-3 [Clostridia bacterium]|nr:translation initiation factor IF-3 [Clostridia bacterium]